MTRHTICILTSGNMAAAAAQWAGEIQSAWSVGRVLVQTISVEEFIALPAARTRFDAVLAVFEPLEPSPPVETLAEALHAAQVPGVCLVPDPARWRSLQQGGLIFEPRTAPPARIGPMIYALAQRQSAVESLTREALLAQRCQGGIRLEMDRLHEELYLAAALQREFTSAPLPRVEGLDFGVLYRPVNFVSGDVYSVRDLGDGRAAFFLADAVGHGVPAALLTMVLTSSLATTQAGRVLEPAEVLRQLNERLCASCLGSGRFATAVYGVIDAPRGEVVLAGAGHPWPMLLSRHGPRAIRTEGPLLAVFADAEFTQETVALAPGDTLLVYTDGFEAVFPDDRTEGRTHLRELSRVMGANADVNACLRRLESLLDEQLGSLHQADDITALAISHTPAAARCAA